MHRTSAGDDSSMSREPTPTPGPDAADPFATHRLILGGHLEGGRELEAAQALLQTLMDTMATPVFLKDRDSRFVGCNQALADYAARPVDEVIGRTDADMPWGALPDAKYVDWDQRVMSTGEPAIAIRERIRKADGSIRQLETNKSPFRNAEGEIIGLFGSFRDITEQVEAEEELQRVLEGLDQEVRDKTAELIEANDTLQREIDERRRLQTEERQQREHVETLRDTAAALSTTLDLDAVLDTVVEGVRRLLSVDLITVVLADDDGAYTVNRMDVTNGYEIDDTRSVVADHAWLREALGPDVANGATITMRPSRALGNAESALAAAMVVGGQRVGYLLVESRYGNLASRTAAQRLGAIAGQAAATIATIRLSVAAAELAAGRERKRMGKDLHDSVSQTLWSLAASSSAARSMVDPGDPLHAVTERIHQLTSAAQAEMRALLLEIWPDELAKLSLRELLVQLAAGLRTNTTAEVTVEVAHIEADADTTAALYRIAQEAVNNAVRHSEATAVAVELTAGPTPTLTITDNGVGFDRSSVEPGRLGLAIMGERAEEVGAELEIISAPGEGTAVRVVAPSVLGLDTEVPELKRRNRRAAAPVDDLDALPGSTRPKGRPVVWALGALVATLAAVLLLLAGNAASDEADASRDIEALADVHDVRVSIVRAQLDELDVLLSAAVLPIDEEATTQANEFNTATVARGRAELEAAAARDGAAAAEARRVLEVLDGWQWALSGPRTADQLYGIAGAVQFEGVTPPQQPPTEFDAVADLLWLDQSVRFLFQESVVARHATDPSGLEIPASTQEFFDLEAPSVEAQPGYLGPNPEQPLSGGAVDPALARSHAAETVDAIDALVAATALWEDDQWVRSWTAGPLGPPPSTVESLTDRSTTAVSEIRQVADTRFAQFIETTRADASAADRAATWFTSAGLLVGLLALAMLARSALLARRRSQLLARAAETDPLTGLGNRKVLDEIRDLVADPDLVHHVVITIDMDRFKVINDTHGHRFGDELLVRVANGFRRIQESELAESTKAVRLGGDEFLLTLHDHHPIDTEAVSDRLVGLRDSMAPAPDGSMVRPEFSYGLIEADGSPDLDDLLEASDLAAYEDKAERRDRRRQSGLAALRQQAASADEDVPHSG